jgi:DNA-binding transcriptional regulator YiaG
VTIVIAVNERGYRIGERHQRAKISDETVDLIRELREDYGISTPQIAAALDIPLATVRSICYYQCRAQVPHNWKRIHVSAN